MNRQLRRLQQFGKSLPARRSHDEMVPHANEIYDHSTPPDVTSVHAKSQAKGKMTADKWNQ